MNSVACFNRIKYYTKTFYLLIRTFYLLIRTLGLLFQGVRTTTVRPEVVTYKVTSQQIIN